jgi:hypothetical protein
MSKPFRLFALLVTAALLVPTLVVAQEKDEEETQDLLDIARAGSKNSVELYYSSLSGAKPDAETALKIPAREIELPYGKITLDGGWLIPIQPKEIKDKDNPDGLEVPEREFISAVYIGEGRFEVDAPNETERWAMNFHLSDMHPTKKYSDVDGVDVAIEGGAVLFFEGSWRDLFLEGTEAGEVDSKTADQAEKMWKARGDLFQGQMARLNTFDTLTGKTRDGLVLDVQQRDIKGVPAFSYMIDPQDTDHEQVQMYAVRRYALNKDVTNWWPLMSWFHPDDVHPPGRDEPLTDRELGYSRLDIPYDVSHYDMDMTVYRDSDAGYWGMKVECDFDMSLVEESNTIAMALMSYGENEFDGSKSIDEVRLTGSNRVIVTGVWDQDDQPLEYMHNGHVLTILLPKTYKKGEEFSLKVKYHGLFIMTMKQASMTTSLTESRDVGAVADVMNFRVPNDYPWFPQNQSHKDGYTFSWVLRLPKPMLAATSGSLVGFEEQGKYNVHTIEETTPVTFPAMLFGRFSVIENDPDIDAGEYKIRLYVHPGFEKDAKSFLDEAQGVIAFYEALFGPYPFNELDIAQMPVGIGYAQAPAGLIQMDGATYISKTDLVNLFNADDTMLDIRDNFVPHEIAHEWWGHKAGWGSSRDQWVSETFAEYSAALYIEEREARKAGDPDSIKGYETRKRRWGVDGRLGHTFDRTGPVWIGNRTGKRRTSAIYARGPLILDMVRDNFGKEAVVKVMYLWCELAEKNDGKVVTEDLQLVLEKALPGVGFDEFMKMYIKGNEPLPDDPKLKKAEKQGKARY